LGCSSRHSTPPVWPTHRRPHCRAASTATDRFRALGSRTRPSRLRTAGLRGLTCTAVPAAFHKQLAPTPARPTALGSPPPHPHRGWARRSKLLLWAWGSQQPTGARDGTDVHSLFRRNALRAAPLSSGLADNRMRVREYCLSTTRVPSHRLRSVCSGDRLGRTAHVRRRCPTDDRADARTRRFVDAAGAGRLGKGGPVPVPTALRLGVPRRIG
jgi:hypothetical protein